MSSRNEPARLGEPAFIIPREPQHRPVAAPDQPFGAECIPQPIENRRNAFRRMPKVKRGGSFTTAMIKALSKGSWRVQGSYTAKSQPTKSRYVYFKA